MRVITAALNPRFLMKRGWKLMGMVSPNMAKKVARNIAQNMRLFFSSKEITDIPFRMDNPRFKSSQ